MNPTRYLRNNIIAGCENIATVCLCALLLAACATVTPKEMLLRDGIHNIRDYRFDPESSLKSRIAEIPASNLAGVKQLDQRDDYLPYMPTAAERELLSGYMAQLPAAILRTMQNRLVAIYFVRNLKGAGMTDFVLSTDGKVYAVIYASTDVLGRGMSEWLTMRENSAFIQETGGAQVVLECGGRYEALMYLLLHESAHVYDYVHRVTPFADRAIVTALGEKGKESPFVTGVWDDYDVPAKQFGLTDNRQFHPYGFSPPALHSSTLGAFYGRVFRSPMVSGYATTNWAEDFAESVTFYHLTRTLNQSCSTTVREPGKAPVVYRPMESPLVQRRWGIIEKLP